jgi:hypothetical protein
MMAPALSNPRDLAFHHKILLAMADRHFDV